MLYLSVVVYSSNSIVSYFYPVTLITLIVIDANGQPVIVNIRHLVADETNYRCVNIHKNARFFLWWINCT